MRGKWNHLSMTCCMRNKCTTNYCNRTNLVQVIVEDVMTFLRHSVWSVITLTHLLFIFIWCQWFLLVQPSATLVSNSYEFLHNFYSLVQNDDWFAAQLLAEILCIRDDDFRVLFNDGEMLSSSELYTIYSSTLILYRRGHFINHLLTYLLTYCHMLHRVVVDSQFICVLYLEYDFYIINSSDINTVHVTEFSMVCRQQLYNGNCVVHRL